MASERSLRRRRRGCAGLALGLSVALLLAAGPGVPVARAAGSAARPPSIGAAPTTTIRLRGPWPGIVSAPADVAVTADAIWVLQPRAGEVDRIDPATNRVVARVKLPAKGCMRHPLCGINRIVADVRNVWVTVKGPDTRPGTLVHIDARTNRVRGSVSYVGPLANPPVIDGDDVWTTLDAASGDIVRIDGASHSATATVHVADTLVAPIAVVGDVVWASTTGGFGAPPSPEVLYRVDPETATVTAMPAVGGFPAVVVDGDIWLARLNHPEIARIDGRTGAVEQSVPVDGGTLFLASGGGSIWVGVLRNSEGVAVLRQSIVRIAVTDGATQTYEMPTAQFPAAMAFGHDSLWISDGSADALYRARLADL